MNIFLIFVRKGLVLLEKDKRNWKIVKIKGGGFDFKFSFIIGLGI